VIATSSAMKLADYVVTEAGFGADLGAEKFIDIKCRKSGPATVGRGHRRDGARDEVPRRRRLKTITRRTWRHSKKGSPTRAPRRERAEELRPSCVVSINRFNHDTKAELDLLARASPS